MSNSPETQSDTERRAGEELNVDIVPGTEIMRDVGGTHFAHSKGTDEVLVPHPTTDPKDPLNWAFSWKLMVFISQWLFTWISVTGALSIAPMFPLLGAEFHLDQSQLSLLTNITVITLGFANIFIVPLSNIFGRRPVSIVFAVLIVLTCIWEAVATSHASFLGARAINGVVCAVSETILVQVIADVFFLHERGLWTGLYFTGYFLGAFLGPIMAGNIAALHGWRSFFWLEVALSGFAVIMLIFTFPETKYHREYHAHVVKHGKLASAAASLEGAEKEGVEKGITATEKSKEGEDVATIENSKVGLGRPSKGQYGFMRKPDARWKQFIIRDLTTPILVFFNPIIFWAGLMLAGPADVLLLFNLTESVIFAAPPYNWNPGQVGYANFAFVVGGAVGVCTAGPFSDWVARRATKRNNGIREAEMRLPAMLPYVAFLIVSIVVGGIGYERSYPWPATIVLGYGLSGLAVVTIPTIAIAYAVDCYKPISGEIMVCATVLKNLLGFSYSYWVFQLAQTQGFITVFMVQLAITLGPALFGIPLYFYGKQLRRWTKDSNLHRMEAII